MLDLFSQYNLEWMLKNQMFIADKSGDAAIIEGDDIVRKDGSYQIVANFHQSKTKASGRPCEWLQPGCKQYKIAESMLANRRSASVALFRDILKATHRNTMFSTTQYSNVYDLKKGIVYLYYKHNFDKTVVIDLEEELKKGRHYYELPALFGEKLKYHRKKYTHPDPAFSISYPGHYKVTKPVINEVLRVKYPISASPLFGVFVEDRPTGIQLQDIGPKYFIDEVKRYSTQSRLVSSAPAALKDGTPANEVLFDRVIEDHWPFKTMIVQPITATN